jgi:hypothetical protein
MTSLIYFLIACNIAAILFAGSKYAVTHRAEQRYWREKYILDSALDQHPHVERAGLADAPPASCQARATHSGVVA